MNPVIQTLGIDASLNGTGLCLFTGSDTGYELTQRELIMEKDKGVTRLRSLRTLFNEWLDANGIDGASTKLALIEGYAYGASGRIAHMGEWGGLIRVALADRGIDIAEMHNAHLKQFVTGKGNSQKNEMLLGIFKRFGVEYASDDAGDAFALAAAAQASLLGPAMSVTRWQTYFGRAMSAQESTAAAKIEQLWKPSSAPARARPVKR